LSTKLTVLNGLTQNITTRTSFFMFLNLVDYILTAILITNGFGLEGNPVLAELDLWQVGVIKILGSLLVIHFFGSRVGMMRLLVVGMGVVVMWNTVVLLAVI